MFRSATSDGMLKPIALIAGLAILCWSLGLPSLRFVEAANVSNFSDTLSDSAPNADSDHTIAYTTTDGVAAGETIVVTFPAGFNLTGLTVDDIDLVVDTNDQTLDTAAAGATWGVSVGASTVTITSDTATIGTSTPVEILIGTNASSGVNQINNPGSTGSFDIELTSGDTDTGSTIVVILASVEVSAAVDTIFTFSVSGVETGGTVNGEAVTGGATTTTIPFGTLDDGNATTTAQLLSVSTNAANGYVVTVQVDGGLRSSTGAEIAGFVEGNDTDVPTTWASPSGTVGSPDTYGHWGITTDDYNTFARGTEFSATNQWIAATNSPRAVMGNNGPVNGADAGVGTTTVGFRVEISALQAAADDYATSLTYVATPTF